MINEQDIINIITNDTICFFLLVIEKEIVSVSTKGQKEKETQQEIITSLTLQLKEKDELLSEATERLTGVQEIITSSKLKGRYNCYYYTCMKILVECKRSKHTIYIEEGLTLMVYVSKFIGSLIYFIMFIVNNQ